jgi:hypothetical protein
MICVAAIGAKRKRGGKFTLLFHDTHHRAVSEPKAMKAYDLSGYDGVRAFGETLAEVYRGWGWGNDVLRLARGPPTSAISIRPPRKASGASRLDRQLGEGERTKELRNICSRRLGSRPWPGYLRRALS